MNSSDLLALDMVDRFLPYCNIVFFDELLPAETACNILDLQLFGVQIIPGSLPALPVMLPVDRRSGYDPIPARSKQPVYFNQVLPICTGGRESNSLNVCNQDT